MYVYWVCIYFGSSTLLLLLLSVPVVCIFWVALYSAILSLSSGSWVVACEEEFANPCLLLLCILHFFQNPQFVLVFNWSIGSICVQSKLCAPYFCHSPGTKCEWMVLFIFFFICLRQIFTDFYHNKKINICTCICIEFTVLTNTRHTLCETTTTSSSLVMEFLLSIC